MHEYSFAEILAWLLHGVWQWVLDLIPLVRPAAETGWPPAWWWRWFSWTDWYWNLDANQVPNSAWIDHWLHGSWRLLRAWVDEVGDQARERAVEVVVAFTGRVAHGYLTFEAWLSALRARVGTWVPWFALNLADGVLQVFELLPLEIRMRWQSWSSVWDVLKDAVKVWVALNYNDARDWILDKRDWLQSRLAALDLWWSGIHAMLDLLKANPRGFVAGLLGLAWVVLEAFAEEAALFWYNTYHKYAELLTELLSDPMGWVYDRAEDELVRRW